MILKTFNLHMLLIKHLTTTNIVTNSKKKDYKYTNVLLSNAFKE